MKRKTAESSAARKDCMSGVVHESIRYRDEPGYRVLDMRPDGVGYLPVCSCRTGRVFSNPPAMHVHPGVVEICHCVRGSLSFETPERMYPFLPGCVFTSREKEPHRMTTNPRGLFVYRMLMKLPARGKRFDGLDATDSAWLRERIISLPRRYFVSGPELRIAFERLFAAYDDRSHGAERRRIELRRRALDVLLVCVDAAEKGIGRHRNPQIEDLVRRMEDSPEADYNIKDMCRDARMRPVEFTRAFKEISGLPPGAYLRNCRIRAAMKLLDAGSSIVSTALRLKFCSAQYFATVFKQETGISPRAWRKR